ncbi:hypothetical protein IKG13_01960, partial [Candidatus Saccharibacteria bacterium]|nr:hypothetical protein [Candidatus Saccharibacteria bacterium]
LRGKMALSRCYAPTQGHKANVCFNPLFLFLYLVSTLSTFLQWNPAERTSLGLVYHDYAYSSRASSSE